MIVTDDSTRIKGKKKLNKRKGQAKIKKNILGGEPRIKIGKRMHTSLRKKLECQ